MLVVVLLKRSKSIPVTIRELSVTAALCKTNDVEGLRVNGSPLSTITENNVRGRYIAMQPRHGVQLENRISEASRKVEAVSQAPRIGFVAKHLAEGDDPLKAR